MRSANLPFPLHILVMDVLGSALVGAGIYGLATKAEIPGMEFLQVVDGAWYYLFCGILMWIPMFTHVLKPGRRINRR